jgi:segregation and condensation protein B
MNEFQQKIEALLFYQNQPVSYQWLARYVGVSVGTVRDEIAEMKKYYEGRGIGLVVTEEEVALVTSLDQNEVIEQLRDDESLKELSKQSFETLAIILYRGKGITKPEIDFIRGVNTTYTLRNLMIRGLVDKKTNPQDKRSPLYIPTLDLLSYLGVTQVEELSSFEVFSEKIQKLQTRFFDELQEILPTQE